MGTINFKVARPDLLLAGSDLSLVDFLLYDGRVLPAKATLEGNLLRCQRVSGESGQLRIPWPDFDGNIRVAHSTSLREQAASYDLEVELARGQLARLRNQYNTWTAAGLQTTADLEYKITEAHRSFRAAVLRTEAPEVASGASLMSMHLSAVATDLLCQQYTEQRIGFRRNRTPHMPMFLGCQLDQVPQDEKAFIDAFNAVLVATPWNMLEPRDGEYEWRETDRLVEWAQEHKISIMGGPLVDLSVNRTPPWLRTWTGDLVNLQSFTSDFVETVVGRYVGRIRHWEVVAGANCGGSGELNEEQRMNLVARAVEAAQQVDEHVLISVRVVQPWGEYLSRSSSRLAPIQFVDTLRRCGVALAEINLEVCVAEQPRTVLPRDSLSLSQLLDHWSLLQLPINVMLSLPQSTRRKGVELETQQSEWLERALEMCLAKERVAGAYCLNWQDASEGPTRTGLKLNNGTNRPALNMLQTLRRAYWG